MKTHIQRWIPLFLLFAASLAVTACNTTRGLGEDVEEVGEGIQDATK